MFAYCGFGKGACTTAALFIYTSVISLPYIYFTIVACNWKIIVIHGNIQGLIIYRLICVLWGYS